MSVTLAQFENGTFPLSFTTACSVGDLIVVGVGNNATTYGNITDSVNTGTYSQPSILQVENPGGAVGATAIAYMVCNAAGTPTVSCSQSGATGVIMRYTGFSGTPTLDTGACATATGNDVSPVNNGATAGFTPELLCGFISTNNVGPSSVPSGWTKTGGALGYYQLAAPAGAFTFDTSYASASKIASIVAGFYGVSAPSTRPGQFFFADAKIPGAALAMFMPLSWAIGRRNRRAQERREERRIIVPGDRDFPQVRGCRPGRASR